MSITDKYAKVAGTGGAVEAQLFALLHARSSHPITSHEAAATVPPMLPAHHGRILGALATGPAGKDEIARRAGLAGIQVSRRLMALHDAGLIKLTGRCVRSDAGLREQEWTLGDVSNA